jgi:hypothetical protein
MRLAPVLLVTLVACGHAPPKKPAATEMAADKPADIAGRWVTNDELDWGYSMTIEASGVIDVWIDRGKMGRCEQKGTIKPAGQSRVFQVVYTRGDCNKQAVGVPMELTVESFTGEVLTVSVADQKRTYTKAP